MKQLDLSKQNEQTKRTQVPVKSSNVAQECKEQEKREGDKNLVVASNNDSTMRMTGNNELDNALSERVNEDERKMNENVIQDEPMEIAENDDSRKADVSIHEVIVNRTVFSSPETVNRDPSIVDPDPPLQSPISDPRFYVCTSFATSTPKTVLSRRETNVGSSFPGSSISASSSFKSSQSFQFHDYCLSEGEFDITLPSQSTSSDISRTARSKEAEIFRQIEGDGFDEENFFNDLQVPLKLDLVADDDVAMLPM